MDELSDSLIQEATKLFSEYDFDKSGFIEVSELHKLMTDIAKEVKIPLPTHGDIQNILSEYDKNSDNKISRQEFLDLFKMLYVLKNMKN